jgi:hypothetical protein
MTKLFEEAIERVRQLPEALQDEAAEFCFLWYRNAQNPSPSTMGHA